LVEGIAQRIFREQKEFDLNDYKGITDSLNYVASRGELRFLTRFYEFLQVSVSHYTLDEDSSVRLMLKYYDWLLRIREYVKKAFDLEILQNLEDYPLEQDNSLDEYREKIAELLNSTIYTNVKPNNRFYIQKSKPFFVSGKTYYEITITPADDYSSKFNRFTVFSNKEIPAFYAIKLDFIDDEIEIINRKMPVRIVNTFEIAIRPVELNDISTIVGLPKVNTGTREYHEMMTYLTNTGMNLVEIIDLKEPYYNEIKQKINALGKSTRFFDVLDKCREFSLKKELGYITLRYLLLKLRHKIMKPQILKCANNWFSYLFLVNGALPFENMPFDASLVDHNPKLLDIFSCISGKGREHELLSRRIRTNTEQKVQLYTPLKDLEQYGDVSVLASKFNNLLVDSHKPIRSIIVDKQYAYINGYETDTVEIIKNLSSRIGTGLQGYKNSIIYWLENNPAVDCAEKKDIIKNMFLKYNLALIYGAAGTGKTTLIKHIADYFASESKLFLSYTNPAKENLRRKIKSPNSEYSTISSCKQLLNKQYSVVFIDECSTVDNRAMLDLLRNLSCGLLILVGDVYQIQSVKFGNWFSLVRYFLPGEMIYELKTPFRSKNQKLIGLWDKVRLLDDKIDEYITRNGYKSNFSDDLFINEENDEVILCLNYDGLYGINNLNRFRQNDNPSPAVQWDTWIYKVGDPIVFNEFNRFYPILYNNLKGTIRKITKSSSEITFEIEVDMNLNEFSAAEAGFELLDCNVPGHSLIRFSVDHFVDDDNQERERKQVVPFQIAYAISIHKAQGLEFDSVKIVITNEIDELITHNIFYTAITRARKSLKIFWTPETQNKVLSGLKAISSKKDACIISSKFDMKILNNVQEIK
jgi:hypothetical protein